MTEANHEARRPHLGTVIRGSLTQGVEIKLDRSTSVEDIAVGAYVAIQGQRNRTFGMISDVHLEALDPTLPLSPPDLSDPFTADVMEGTAFYGVLDVLPMLVLDAETGETRPVRTVPPHFASVSLASAEDVGQVFGHEDATHLAIGQPLEMDVDVVLDLRAVAERSSGVFGKSGTGKTFLVRQLLAGLVKGRVASTLVFDMHNEYGWMGRDHERGREVKGLKQLFGSRVVVLTLDPESSQRRGVPTDGAVRIGYGEIEPEDIEVLAESLNLTDMGRQLPYRLGRLGGDRWLRDFLDLDGDGLKDLAADVNENESTVQALRRRLETLKRFAFLSKEGGNRAVESIMDYLDRGFSVVLEFGQYERQELAYILVANLLTRRIHESYVRRMERAMGDSSQEPQPLIIVIEEAHKFLSPGLSNQTIFGAIAREMRKYGVTLLIVDQRPSSIDDEILSQIGTKLACLLDNDKDVDAVLSGVSGRSELRHVLSRLESVQQALLFGHALPMPVVVRTREYGSPESYAAFSVADALESKEEYKRKVDDLFG